MTSNGEFYAVFSGTPQPFREPGVDIRDFPSTIDLSVGPYTTTGGVTYTSKPALFDDNPERILVDSDLLVVPVFDGDGRDIISIAAGTLDAPSGLSTTLQIHTKSAGDYYAVDPSIPIRPE